MKVGNKYIYLLDIVNTNKRKKGNNKRKYDYFPIQKLENICPKRSSVDTCPVISPKWYNA